MTDTIVTFLLDKSGSMASCYEATVEAFNAYVLGLRKDGAPISFSLIQFDSVSIETTWKNAPLSEVGEIGRHNYKPMGSTPLIDAAYKAIKATEKRAAELGDPKVVVCIQTDGEENASTEHTWDELNALIKEKSALGWQFNFMGVGLDAYKQAMRMGVSIGSTVSYDNTSRAATADAFLASAANTSAFSKGLRGSTEYSAEQKAKAGDTFAPTPAASTPPSTPPLAQGQTKKPGIVDDIDL